MPAGSPELLPSCATEIMSVQYLFSEARDLKGMVK
jgi:hypothetical protein